MKRAGVACVDSLTAGTLDPTRADWAGMCPSVPTTRTGDTDWCRDRRHRPRNVVGMSDNDTADDPDKTSLALPTPHADPDRTQLVTPIGADASEERTSLLKPTQPATPTWQPEPQWTPPPAQPTPPPAPPTPPWTPPAAQPAPQATPWTPPAVGGWQPDPQPQAGWTPPQAAPAGFGQPQSHPAPPQAPTTPQQWPGQPAQPGVPPPYPGAAGAYPGQAGSAYPGAGQPNPGFAQTGGPYPGQPTPGFPGQPGAPQSPSELASNLVAKGGSFLTQLMQRGMRGELIKQPWFQAFRQSPDQFMLISYGVVALLALLFAFTTGIFGSILSLVLWAALAYVFFAIGTLKAHKLAANGIGYGGAVIALLGTISPISLLIDLSQYNAASFGIGLVISIIVSVITAGLLGLFDFLVSKEIKRLSQPGAV